MSLIIRNFTPDDIPECATVFYQVFGPSGCGESWTPETSEKHVVENTFNAQYCFVAVEEGKIVGLVFAFPVTRELDTDVFVETLGVLTTSQGQHIGSTLLEKVTNLGKANGAKHVRLMANPKFVSYDWYTHKGMKPSGWVELERPV